MRRLLGFLPALLLVPLVSACGDDEAGTVTSDPAPTVSTSAPSDTGGSAVEVKILAMMTETAAGGTVSETPVPLPDDDAVAQFNQHFDTDALPTRILEAVHAADVPDDELLYGAVVAIGCDAPTQVTVTEGDSGLLISAVEVPKPLEECFAPMTTVALVLIPASAA